ncbi:hypothetical protein HZH68_007623 [Vespula germanica]|uniref:Uncharacterized protein n=1 Tax=Vespula germanica TaxID=30212 RepID=A0A834K804_VESGE|nr:hypothetical protein HZH68_007623 [Vespula germanica]
MVRSSEQTLNASDDGKQRPPGRSTEESFSFRENLKDAYVKISRLMGMSSAKQIYKVFTSPWKNSKDTSVYYSLTEAETTYPTLDSQPHARVARMGPDLFDRSSSWNRSHLDHRDFIGNVRNVNKEDWSNEMPGGTLHVLQYINASQPSDSMKFSKETCCDGRDDGVALSISTIANCLTKGQRRNLPTTPLKSVLPD